MTVHPQLESTTCWSIRQHLREAGLGMAVLARDTTCRCPRVYCPAEEHEAGHDCTGGSEEVMHWPRSRVELVEAGLDPTNPDYALGMCGVCRRGWGRTSTITVYPRRRQCPPAAWGRVGRHRVAPVGAAGPAAGPHHRLARWWWPRGLPPTARRVLLLAALTLALLLTAVVW